MSGLVIQAYFPPSGGPRATALVPPRAAAFATTGGERLTPAVLQKMEAVFATSFADVRVHVGSAPQALGASAFTHGVHIHFAPGQYAPQTPHGERMLAHELTHVVQQRAQRVRSPFPSGMALVHDHLLEAEAERMSARVATAGPPRPAMPVQRLIIGHDAGPLPPSAPVLAGLTAAQQARVQAMHGHARTYKPETARADALRRFPAGAAAAAAASSSSSASSLHTPPFPFRFSSHGAATMSTVSSGAGGFVHYPAAGLPERKEAEDEPMIAVAAHSGFSALPTSSHRGVTQSAVWGGISPNDAARELGLSCPLRLSWEWLHLIAFSISPTHVNEYPSAESIRLLNRTYQPQQIRENLVLGSAAANTQMLMFETRLKDIMRAHRGWELQLWCAADVERRTVHGVVIPLARLITYTFQFRVPSEGRISPPIILAFDTQSHDRPTRDEYSKNVDVLNELHRNLITPPNMPVGMSTSGMASVGRSGARASAFAWSDEENKHASLRGVLSPEDLRAMRSKAGNVLEDGAAVTVGGITYRVRDLGAGGHCMYLCALFLSGRNPMAYQALRYVVAARLQANHRATAAHITGVLNGDDGDVLTDLTEAAGILGCRFVVHAIGWGGGEIQTQNIGTGGPIHHIVHQGNHFMALLPQEVRPQASGPAVTGIAGR